MDLKKANLQIKIPKITRATFTRNDTLSLIQVEHFAFRELINLVKLDLSDNALTSVPTGSFEMIAQLRELVTYDSKRR